MSKRTSSHPQPDPQPENSSTASPKRSLSAASTGATGATVPSAGASPVQHLLFGSVEDLLADLEDRGAPDGNVVRVERLVRTRRHTMGGVATQGVLLTTRRNDEVLSAWVIVGRLALDPWGQPLDHDQARMSAERHHDAQHLIGAQVADAGFAVRTGLYLLPDVGYDIAATSTAFETLTARGPSATTAGAAVGATAQENATHTTPSAHEAPAPIAEPGEGEEHA